MPTLKQVNCSIELGPGNTKIKEYGARYSDGHVESFIPVPATDMPFSIRLTTHGYIAPGIAFFVFMDGEYQCNRNRQGLKLPGNGILAQDYETEFRVRQKEEKTSFGSFVAREWTFAKLNRVGADKAPNLNPQFTNNVGTIEVIVLRCKSDVDNYPPPRALQPKLEDKPAKGKKAKQSAAPAPAPSAKAGSVQDDMFGGMFGIFDGACDAMNLDGAVDEKSVYSDRSLSPERRLGTVYDPISGHWIPASVLEPPTEIREAVELSSGMRRQVEAIERNVQEASAQLDGHGGQPGVVINQWGERARDDMRGDKCLGLEFDTRSAYKQYLRETGQSVSSHAYGAMQDNARNQPAPHQRAQPNPYYHHQPHQQPAERIAPGPDPINVAQKLEVMRQRFEYLFETYHKVEAQRDLDTVMRLQMLQQRGHGGFKYFPMWLGEYLNDLEIKRQYIMRLQQNRPMMDFSQLKREFEDLQTAAMLNPTLHKEFNLDELDQAQEMYSMFAGRVDLLQKFVSQAEGFSKLSTHDLRSRIEFVSFQRDKARNVVKSLERRMAQNRDGVPQTQGWPDAPAGFHQAAPQAVDGAARQGWPSPGPANGKNGGFNQVGSGNWKPGQNQGVDSWAKGDEGFGGNQQGQWPEEKNGSNRNNAANNDGWQADKNSKGGESNRDGASKGANNQWNNSNSQKTPEHDFSNGDDKKSEQFHASRSRHSSHQSNKDHDWNGDNNQQSQVDGNNWAGNGGSKRDGNDAWGGGSKVDSKSNSTRTAIRVSNDDPTAYIKPYWKDWNKPFNRDLASDATPKKAYEEPREVYTYPASSLPAVPKKAVKDASYGIQPGRGADYTHKTHRPVYIDTMERPYAVFSFKYRSKEALEKILRVKVDDEEIKKVQKLAEEARLSMLPKHKLVEELMAKRAPPKSDSKKGSSNVGNKTASAWGGDKKESEQGGDWNEQGGSNKSASSKWGSKKDDRDWNNGGNGNNANDGWADGGNANNANNGWDKSSKSKSRSSKKDSKGAAPGWDNSGNDQAGQANEWKQASNGGQGGDNFAGW